MNYSVDWDGPGERDAVQDYAPTFADGIESALKIVEAAMGDSSSGEDIREACDARLAVVRSKLIDELSYANLRESGGLASAGG